MPANADTVDNYQIYIKDVLVIAESIIDPVSSTASFLKLDKSNYNETIAINFNHCTAGAADRRIRLIDTTGKIIMQWNFPDKDVQNLMLLPIKSILTNKKIEPNASLNLYCFDDQLPAGRLLTTLQIGDITFVKSTSESKPIGHSNNSLLWILSLSGLIIFMYIMWRRRSTNR